MVSRWTGNAFNETATGGPELFVVLTFNMTIKAEVKRTNKTVLLVAIFDRKVLLEATQVIEFSTLKVSALFGVILVVVH